MSIAPRISKDANGNYDLVFENGAFKWAADGIQAAQHAFIRLMIFKGEQSLGGVLTAKTELGTKWYETIFDMSKPKSEKELEIKRRILDTPGISRFIVPLSWTQSGHTVTITGTVQTDWGAVDLSQTIEAL